MVASKWEQTSAPMIQDPPLPVRDPEVLLVDDMELLLRSVGRRLEKECGVLYSKSAQEALSILESNPSIKVVVSDYSLDGMSGLELFQESAARFPTVARVLMTGVPREGIDAQEVASSDLHSFLRKPFGTSELLAAVRSGMAFHDEFQSRELQNDVLTFSNESLALLNRSLEERVAEHRHSIRCLRSLGIALNGDLCVQEMAQIAARHALEALGGRGVHVQFGDLDGGFAEANAGPEMSTRMLSEPLRTKDGPIGEIVVDLLDREQRPIGSAQRNVLAAIASMTAVAVHNEHRRKQRDETQYATVFALARLSESRDLETGRHLERVSEYSRLTAEGMLELGHAREELSAAFIRDLVMGAPLHDLGKVGIPDSILLKKGRLSASEWKVMRSHPQIGADTLDSILAQDQTQSYLAMGREIALGHHEKWDGSGYPAGLAGEAIPLSARIVALADVYDALTTVRPYKEAWSHERACDLIREESGRHFDPAVAESFLSRHATYREAALRLSDD